MAIHLIGHLELCHCGLSDVKETISLFGTHLGVGGDILAKASVLDFGTLLDSVLPDNIEI